MNEVDRHFGADESSKNFALGRRSGIRAVIARLKFYEDDLQDKHEDRAFYAGCFVAAFEKFFARELKKP